jgi:transposase-like protein
VQARLEDAAQCLLVIIGATPEGKKELVGLTDGVRESARSWKELLLDLKQRGLAIGPELAVADGALGFWQAIEEVWDPRPALLGAQDRQFVEKIMISTHVPTKAHRGSAAFCLAKIVVYAVLIASLMR